MTDIVKITDIIKNYSQVDNAFGTDKITSHSYGDLYDIEFNALIEKEEPNVLEIGIYSGAFLQVMSEFLPKAQIIGIDINTSNVKFGLNNDRIKIIHADGTLPSTAKTLGKSFDLIIEDGSHLPDHQIASLEAFAPYIKPDGVMIIEDIEGSHENYVRPRLQDVATRSNLVMEWIDLRHVKNRGDDIVAMFRRSDTTILL